MHLNEKYKVRIFDIMEEYEKYSYSNIQQVSEGWFVNNKDIGWFSNYVDRFEDENITSYYLNNPIAKSTRWDFWNDIINIFKENNIKTNLDIGCANNHFSFLCNKQNIFSIGIDPREDCLKSCEDVFTNNFGTKSGYVGNIKTFVEFFSEYDEILFDCVSVLNFLHGNDHDPDEINKLFKILPKITNNIIISEPKWSSLRLPKLTKNYKIVESLCKENADEHFLYNLEKK